MNRRPDLLQIALLLLIAPSCTSDWQARSGRILVPDRLRTDYGHGQGSGSITGMRDPWSLGTDEDVSWWSVGLEWDIGPQEIRIVGDRPPSRNQPTTTTSAWYESDRPTLSLGGVDLKTDEDDGGAIWLKLPAALVSGLLLAAIGALGIRRYRQKSAEAL